METKHTPGPWKVEGPHDAPGVSDATGDTMPRTVADARLIAAAPDLLVALQALLAHEGEIEYSGIGGESDSEALEVAKLAARAAIDKAT